VTATVRYPFAVDRAGAGAPVKLREGVRSRRVEGAIPRISRLMALAHRFARQLRDGEVGSMADLAARRGVTRARITQIMDLLLLAPDIQEELLFLPRTVRGHDPITLRRMRYVCATPVWEEQRARWREMHEDGSSLALPLDSDIESNIETRSKPI
jgi:hypothetical protein